MFKHNREKRYNELIACGFMSFEARWLSMIPFAKHQAMRAIMTRRRKLLARRTKEANVRGWSRAKRTRVWNMRTRKMYARRRWICRSDHPSGFGPRAGEPDPFELYRRCERSEINPLPGDSRKPADHQTDADRRWKLDRGQIILMRARQGRSRGDREQYQSAIRELDDIIDHATGKIKATLTAARNRLQRR
jgi:hypothetical protein